MKYVMLIYQDTALERQAALPEDEQKQVYADYQAINQTPGVTPGLPMGLAPERDHGARRRRQNADNRRPVRRHEGGRRRLVHPRGRRPRRGHRGGRPRPRGALWWRRRDSTLRGVLVTPLDRIFREEWGRVLATLIGFLGDFDLAEEAAQEAFAIAAQRWPRDGCRAIRAPG